MSPTCASCGGNLPLDEIPVRVEGPDGERAFACPECREPGAAARVLIFPSRRVACALCRVREVSELRPPMRDGIGRPICDTCELETAAAPDLISRIREKTLSFIQAAPRDPLGQQKETGNA